MSIKSIVLAAIGALLLVLLVVSWGVFAGRITIFVESSLCWLVSAPADCRLKNVHLFVIWTVIGLAALVVFGLVVERFNGRR